MKNSKGITIVSLVITIIVLIILASISIATISGDNSIINHAIKSKEDTEIAEEKELLNKCVSYAKSNKENKYGVVKKEYLEPQLEKYAQGRIIQITEQDITVDENTTEKIIKVTFEKTHHTYNINQDGEIELETSGENQGD